MEFTIFTIFNFFKLEFSSVSELTEIRKVVPKNQHNEVKKTPGPERFQHHSQPLCCLCIAVALTGGH